MPQALIEHRHQAVVQHRLRIIGSQGLCLAQRARRIQPLNQVPGRKVKKYAAGHLAARRPGVPQAQQWHQQRQAKAPVKIGAPDMHASGGQNVAGAVGAGPALGPQAHHGEIRGAAANVHHQHQRFALDALFVIQRCGNGLQLERNVYKPSIQRRLPQGIFGLLVAHGIAIHKMHGAPQQHPARHTAQRFARRLGQHAQEQADDVLVAHQRVVHRRLVLQQRTAQQAFERAHQAPFGARQILRNGIAPVVRAMVFGIEEQRCRQGVVLALQAQHARR